jgi:predicted transcriptional regulator of viral defense system
VCQALLTVAHRQHGLFTYRDVRSTGCRRDCLRTGLTTGRYLRVDRGLYLVAGSPDSPLRRVAEAVLRLPGSVVSHDSAAALWGLDLIEPPTVIQLTVRPGSRRPRVTGLRVHRVGLPADEVTRRHGLACTSLPRTVIDCAGSMPTRAAVVVADAALRTGLLEVADLRRLLDRRTRWPAGTRRAIELADPFAESVLESLLRVLFTTYGIPPPRTQYPVRDRWGRFVLRADFAWPRLMLIVEADGERWHGSERAFQNDRSKQNRAVLLGWRVLRFTWADVLGRPEGVAAQVKQAMAGRY